MEPNENVRQEIFNIVNNQMTTNNPPETKETFNRLKKEGYNDFEARQLIGQCVAVELFEIMKHRKPFDEKRYISNLKQLPKAPFDEE
ncbi:MAG: DUF1841 family protein [Niabella sp.]|nr:DUF1841 family protein [Niabella sp.]